MTAALWSGYLVEFRAVLAGNAGLVPFAATPLAQPRVGIQPLAVFNVSWTNPSLSLMLAPHGEVSTIVANPPGEGWQPFDPAVPDQLPRIEGVDYAAYFRHLQASAN